MLGTGNRVGRSVTDGSEDCADGQPPRTDRLQTKLRSAFDCYPIGLLPGQREGTIVSTKPFLSQAAEAFMLLAPSIPTTNRSAHGMVLPIR
jgi:hypothetical protein